MLFKYIGASLNVLQKLVGSTFHLHEKLLCSFTLFWIVKGLGDRYKCPIYEWQE